jgi:hypothetical protein
MDAAATGIFSNSKKSSMSNILSLLEAAFNIPRKPLTKLPPQLLIVGAKLRPGLSARMITSKIIARQSEAGAPSGAIFKDGKNVMESMINVVTEEVVNALLLDAKIEIVIPPGVQVTATGANGGGPIVVQGATTNMATGDGVIR